MKRHLTLLALIALCAGAALCLLASPTLAQWPTTLEENLPVAADSGVYEGYPMALPYDSGRTLVVFSSSELFNCYQIITPSGQFEFENPQGVAPAIGDVEDYDPHVVSDGSGGAFVVWYKYTGPGMGTYAQRLDNQGNRLWGDSGVLIFGSAYSVFGFSSDGLGGLLYATIWGENEVWAQRVNSNGELLWGPEGVLVCNQEDGQGYPKITHDGNGGAYLVWRDYRAPYGNGSLFMQRLDANGNALWTPNGMVIYNGETWHHALIPDSQSGFIMHFGGGTYNKVYRVAPSGSTLWMHSNASYSAYAQIVEGDSDYFYLGFPNGWGVYGQKMDMQGNTYWPTFGSIAGAQMAYIEGWYSEEVFSFAYQYPYFCGLYVYRRPGSYGALYLYAQSLDSLGNRRYGDDGAMLTYLDTGYEQQFQNVAAVAEVNGGTTGVFESNLPQPAGHDLWAKHVNADGSLGGPTAVPPVGPDSHNRELTLGLRGETIHYALPAPAQIKLELFDLLGRSLAVLAQGYQSAGNHTLLLSGQGMTSGIYLLMLSTPDDRQIVKIAIVQ